MIEDMEASVKRIEDTRRSIITEMAKHEIEPNESLSLLSGMLIEFFYELVEDNSRSNFIDTMTKCFDSYILITSEAKGSIQ